MTESGDLEGREESRPVRSGGHTFGATFGRRLLVITLIGLIVLLAVILGMLLRRTLDAGPGPQGGPSVWPLLQIVGPLKGDAPYFIRPLGTAWGPDGTIYVSDTGNGRVCVFDSAGRFVREFGRAKAQSASSTAASDLEQPAGLVVTPNGDVYVADVRGGAVAVFNSDGKLLRKVTLSRTAALGPWTPTDVALRGGKMYVSDANGIAVFSATGKLMRRIDRAYPGSPFSHPNGVAVRGDGSLVISDTNNGRVVALTPSGTRLWVLRPSSDSSQAVGLPRGISVAPNGQILFADAFLFGVVRISSGGTYIDHYGSRGSDLGDFEFPNDVAVAGELVLVADKENNRVQVLRYPALLAPANATSGGGVTSSTVLAGRR